MKRIFFLICLAFSIPTFSQSPLASKAYIDSVFVGLLQNDGILLTPDQINCKEKCTWPSKGSIFKSARSVSLDNDAYMKKLLLTKFTMNCPPGAIKPDLQFDISMSKMGSMILRNGSLAKLKSTSPADFVVEVNGTQMGYDPDANSSMYKVEYTSTSAFRLTSNSEVKGSYLSYFQAKADYEKKIQSDVRTYLNIAAGIFENKLAQTINKTIINNCEVSEFYPMLQLWDMYTINIPLGQDSVISSKDSVISSFRGICYLKSSGETKISQDKVNATASGGLNAQFLSFKTDAATSYAKEDQVKRTSVVYTIAMLAKPQLQRLPTKNEILNNWTRLSNRVSTIENNSGNIPNDKPLELEVWFGPVPNLDYVNNGTIQIDTAYTLSRMKRKLIRAPELLIPENKSDIPFSGGKVKLKVLLYKNQDAINAYQYQPADLSENISLRLYYNKPVSGAKSLYLDHVYDNIPISMDTKPYFVNAVDEIAVPQKNGNFFEYKIVGRIDLSPGETINTLIKPEITDVDIKGDYSDNDRLSLKKTLKNADVAYASGDGYVVKIKMPQNQTGFNSSNSEIKGAVLKVKFSTKKSNNVLRPIFINIAAPEELVKLGDTSSNATYVNNLQQAYDILDFKKILSDPPYRMDFMNKKILKDTVEILQLPVQGADMNIFFNSITKFNPDFKILLNDLNNKYQVPNKFVDLEKVKTMSVPNSIPTKK